MKILMARLTCTQKGVSTIVARVFLYKTNAKTIVLATRVGRTLMDDFPLFALCPSCFSDTDQENPYPYRILTALSSIN